MSARFEFIEKWAINREAGSDVEDQVIPLRYDAIAMELAAYLDDHYVEINILTDCGKTVSIVCRKDSIFSLQRHIEMMGRDCPEIATWKTVEEINPVQDSNRSAYQAALWEGWAFLPRSK